MSLTRQDAWTQDEDLLLVEVVLRHIREGSTQLRAFEEVGKQVSRTSAACGFRWNSFVRKQYKSGIELAKKQRKEQAVKETDFETETVVAEFKTIEQKTNEERENESITLQEVILYLTKMDELIQLDSKEKERISEHSLLLEQENDRLQDENRLLKENLKVVEEDYRALMQIMERARKLSVLEDEKANPKVSFQMDKNGNLERVNK
ncbi:MULTISPECIES: RsfA family transcriptional regulator [Peribacillus]|uniref:RsfA family transcriptional regulator n=1 Tax=Peribacillus butanolivorans TaxID=421767 RepID=A0AAX0S745_9BACI|nr:RsfA family transcriptional regulator [Peribacillus butanolivorans]AXN40432.1 RsfA family transcriptional regulator [Peribacillus butanolivorans]PEJ35177.1 RsfA family transcriptional regulator [Peribacillus butanolivorans]QNU05683.1 RsfA family transcriptional regulator [Peribacillus butanolivorans]